MILSAWNLFWEIILSLWLFGRGIGSLNLSGSLPPEIGNLINMEYMWVFESLLSLWKVQYDVLRIKVHQCFFLSLSVYLSRRSQKMYCEWVVLCFSFSLFLSGRYDMIYCVLSPFALLFISLSLEGPIWCTLSWSPFVLLSLSLPQVYAQSLSLSLSLFYSFTPWSYSQCLSLSVPLYS